MPRRKKDPSVRARRNKASTAATLRVIPADATPRSELEQLTVAQLRAEIDRRNVDRGPAERLGKTGRKADLVDALIRDVLPKVPPMPTRTRFDHATGLDVDVPWHPQVVEWWSDVWSSAMSHEWDDSDVHNVHLLAMLLHDAWTASEAKSRKEAMTEFRLQRADLGLSPYSRRRLEWTIESAEAAKDQGSERRKRRTVQTSQQPAASGASDPRQILEQ